MYQYFNPNPLGKTVGDCVIRAICAVTGKKWEEAYLDVCSEGYRMCDMPSSNAVWDNYLKLIGFKRYALPNDCPDCYTIKDFCMDHDRGLYVVGTGTHAVGIIDGDYFDITDSGLETPVIYWAKEV